MKARNYLAAAMATAVLSLSYADGRNVSTATSVPTFIFLRPEVHSFWHTAMGGEVELPVDFPETASSATLTVRGVGYEATYGGIVTNLFTVTLPAASSPKTENVYDLVLSFDDGTVRTARVGVVQGHSVGFEGVARCVLPHDSTTWCKVKYRAVLPIPYGTDSVTVLRDGAEPVVVDTCLDGAQGWFALAPIMCGERLAVSIPDGGGTQSASLIGFIDGFRLSVR